MGSRQRGRLTLSCSGPTSPNRTPRGWSERTWRRSPRVHAPAFAGARHLTILVSEDGVGPHALSRDRGPGWGWPLIAALTDSFTIRRRAHGGTEVEMHVSIGPAAATSR